MRIGLVTPAWPGSDSANGIATAVAYMTTSLRSAGHQVTILPLRVSAEAETEPAVVNLPSARAWTILEKLNAKFGRDHASSRVMAERIAIAAARAVCERRIDVLVIEETQGWAGFIQRNVNIPVVVTLHGPWLINGPLQEYGQEKPNNRRREEREREGIENCAGIISPSRHVLQRVEESYQIGHLPRSVIPNPIQLTRPVDYSMMSEAERGSVLFVGRYDTIKGGDIVLEAFSIMARQNPAVRLSFVGPDLGVSVQGERRSIHDAISALPYKIRERIQYRGPLGKLEIEDLRQRHGVAVIASRFENFPYAVLESLASGIATVATSVGGIREIIRDGETGLLVPASNPLCMAEACQRLLADSFLASRIGAAGHADVGARFAPSRTAERMVNFLSEVRSNWRGRNRR